MRSRGISTALFLSLALAGPARAQHLASSPPPPRTFGPDSRAPGVFTGAGVTKAGLSCDAPAPGAAQTCAGYLASGADGTLLETTVRIPAGPGMHPLVVSMHGWGGSQGSMAKYDDRLISAGYAVLRYSARGFGGSWGQANLADPTLEGVDLRSEIAQVVDLYPAVDGGAVAVFGASYGGAHAWLGAIVPQFTSRGGHAVTIRTVIPVAAWSDLLNGLVPNGRPDSAQDPAGAQKLSFVEGLFAGGIRTRTDRPYPNYPEYLVLWDAGMLANEEPYAATPTGRSLADGLGYRSVYWQQALWERVRQLHATGAPQLPVLAVQGWTDDLFPPVEALRMYDALRSIDPAYPIALYLGDLGHPRAANKAGELDYALDAAIEWLGYWMKGEGTKPAFDVRAAITRPRTAPFSASDVLRVPTYTDLATSTAIHKFGGWKAITFDPVNLSGFKWDPLVLVGCAQLQACPPPPPDDPIPGDVAVYELKAAEVAKGAPFLLAGEPAVMAYVATVAHRVQLDFRLLDVAPNGTRSLVTRGTITLDSGSVAPLGMRRVRLAGFGNLWEFPADHTVRLELTNVDSPYLRPSLVPSASALSDVSLSMPIRDAPQPAVAVASEAPAAAAAPSTAGAVPAAPAAAPIAGATPAPTTAPIASAVPTATATSTPTSSAIPVPTTTSTSTPTSTSTATPTSTSIATPTSTPAPTAAAIPTAAPAPTALPIPTATPAPAPTPAATPASAPAAAPAPVPTAAPAATTAPVPVPAAVAPSAAPVPTAALVAPSAAR